MREIAEWLDGAARAAAPRASPAGSCRRAPDTPPPPLEFTIEELLEAVERVLAMMPDPVIHRVVPRPLDVEAATARLMELLAERASASAGASCSARRRRSWTSSRPSWPCWSWRAAACCG